MKLKIYYFTGTGNSLMIARDIAKEFDNAAIISMTKLMKNEKVIRLEGDMVGFVFPVYFTRPPAFVKEFMENVLFGSTSYIFAVMNGGGLFGRALHLFDAMLKEKGRRLDAGFIIPMPGNHPKVAHLQRKDPETYHKEEAEKARYITNIIKARQPHKIETNRSLLCWLIFHLSFKKAYRLSLAKKLDSDLWVDDTCTHCGTCELICPTGNITYALSKPEWHNNCINCAACYHHCPTKAIRLGKEDPSFRYNHPDISLQDIVGNFVSPKMPFQQGLKHEQ